MNPYAESSYSLGASFQSNTSGDLGDSVYSQNLSSLSHRNDNEEHLFSLGQSFIQTDMDGNFNLSKEDSHSASKSPTSYLEDSSVNDPENETTFFQTLSRDRNIGPLTSTPVKPKETFVEQEDMSNTIMDSSHEISTQKINSLTMSSIGEHDASVVYEDDHVIALDRKRTHKRGETTAKRLYAKAMTSIVVAKIKIKKCTKCCFVGVTKEYIRSARSRLWTKSYDDRVEWFSDKYEESSFGQNNVRWFTAENGKKVCPKCFMNIYRINKNFYYQHIARFNHGAVSATIRKDKSTSEKIENAVEWLNDYAVFHGDRMPDKNIVLLPYRSRKIDIYRAYEDESVSRQQQPISRSAFYRIWKTKFANLKIKQTNSFSKCHVCTKLQSQKESTRDIQMHRELKRLMKVHNNRQKMERRYYKAKREKAKTNKHQFLSLIIDGMDQAKTNIPHFTGRKPNDLDMANLLSTHVQGVINHGRETFSKYIDLKEYPHDSNMVMNTILKEIYETSQSMDQKLPPVLFIQADNCFRENKNKFVLAFCELLVRKNIFREVQLSFLIVGHTHEDIDAGFSKIADRLRRNDAETIPRLLNVIPNSQQLRGLYDIKNWIAPYINMCYHHTKPHHFRFTQHADAVEIEYKGSYIQPWTRLTGTLLKQLPVGIPKIIMPSFAKISIEALEKNIDRCRLLFTEYSQFLWWKRFIRYLESLQTDQTAIESYAKLNARWLLPHLPIQPAEHVSDQAPVQIDEELHELLDRELDDPIVVLQEQGQRQKTQKQKNLERPGISKQ